MMRLERVPHLRVRVYSPKHVLTNTADGDMGLTLLNDATEIGIRKSKAQGGWSYMKEKAVEACLNVLAN